MLKNKSVFLSKYKILSMLTVVVLVLIGSFIILERIIPNPSNNTTLIVEVGVGLIIALFVHRTSKKTEYNLDVVLTEIREKVDIDYRSSINITNDVYRQLQSQINRILYEINALENYYCQSRIVTKELIQDKDLFEKLFFGFFRKEIKKSINMIQKEDDLNLELGGRDILGDIRRALLGLSWDLESLKEIQKKHAVHINKSLDDELNQLFNLFDKNPSFFMNRFYSFTDLEYLSWYIYEFSIHCKYLQNRINKMLIE